MPFGNSPRVVPLHLGMWPWISMPAERYSRTVKSALYRQMPSQTITALVHDELRNSSYLSGSWSI